MFNSVSVRLGEWDQSTEMDCTNDIKTDCAPPVQDIKVESFKVHEMYNDELSVNDIMMIKLEHPVQYARNIRTICLPTDENEIISKSVDLEQLTITGWGREGQKSYSDIMLFDQLSYLPLDECKEKIKVDGMETELYESHICAKIVNLEDSCLGIDISNN